MAGRWKENQTDKLLLRDCLRLRLNGADQMYNNMICRRSDIGQYAWILQQELEDFGRKYW